MKRRRGTLERPRTAVPGPRVRRCRFLEATGTAVGAALAGGDRPLAPPPSHAVQPCPSPDVAVVRSSTFSIWTALHLQRLGTRVTVVGTYGADNSRLTSADATRGVQSRRREPQRC